MAFWDFLLLDSEYNKMIVKESAGRIANDNIAETREQIFSKFANLTTGSKSYDDLDSFLGLFSNNFPKEYERLISNEPRNTRKAVKQKIFERFEKILEFNTTRDKGGRPKLDFEGQMTKFANSETVNTKILDAFYRSLMEKYESYTGKKENNINRLRKEIGKENLGKILPILKQNVNDSNAKLADFDNPDKIMFNVMKITIAIGNFGVKLPKKVAGFTKTEENDTQIKGMNATQQNSYTTYEKIVPIEGYDRKKTREEWIDGMDKYIEIDYEKRRGQLEEESRLKLKGDSDFELSIVYIEDRPLLRELLSKQDIVIIDDINIDVGMEAEYTVPALNSTKIQAYFDAMATSSKSEQSNKDKYLAFKLGKQSLQAQRKILYFPQKSGSRRLYFHPILQNLFTTEGNNVFGEATKDITVKTAKAFEQAKESELDKEVGIQTYDRELIEEEIFDEDNMLENDELYADYIEGDEFTHIVQESGTEVERLQRGLVFDGKSYITKNRNLISFINAIKKFAINERGTFSNSLAEENKDKILGEVSDKVEFTKPAEIAFADFLLSQKDTKEIENDLITGDLSKYYKAKMNQQDGFAFLFSIVHLFGQDLKTELKQLIGKKKLFTKKDLSTEGKSLITKIVAKVEENLRKLRTQFKEGLEQKLEKIAKNPKKNPRTLIKKLVDKQLLEMEE
jgi:hypothetical protein